MTEDELRDELATLEHALRHVGTRLSQVMLEAWKHRMLEAKLLAIERQVCEVVKLCDDTGSREWNEEELHRLFGPR